VKKGLVSICVIVVGIVLLTMVPYLVPAVAFKMNSYHSTVGLWDLSRESGQNTSNKTTPPKNYFLLPNSSREDTFLKCAIAVGARSVYVEPANLGEVSLEVETGTVDIYFFDENNSDRWKAAQAYEAVFEAKETGTANLTFRIPIDAQTLNLTVILLNNSPTPKNVTLGGRLRLVAEWTASISDPLAVTGSIVLGFGTITCGMTLLISTIIKERLLRMINIGHKSKIMLLSGIIILVTVISLYLYHVDVSRRISFGQDLDSITSQYMTVQVPASRKNLSGIRLSHLSENPATLPLKEVHNYNDFEAILIQRPVSTVYYNDIDRSIWFLTLQPGEQYTYELQGQTHTYQPMDVTVIYYAKAILGMV